PELREVQRLMEGADVRRAVAEEGDRDVRLGAHLEGERRADDSGQPAPDDRVRAEEPALDVVEVHRAAVAAWATLDLAVQLRHDRVRGRAVRERVAVRAVGGSDHIAVLERAAHADGGRLLAERHMEEPGQLAGPEALLDLLLEAADQEHVPVELEQELARDLALAFNLGHSSEFMLAAWGWWTSGGRSSARCRRTGRTRGCSCMSAIGASSTAQLRCSRR